MAFKLGQNKAYLKTALDSLLGTVNGTGFKNGIIQQTAAGTFSALTKSTSVTAQSTDNEIPTAAAVKAAVDGATPVWGNITGTLSNQTDLNTVLTNTSTQIASLSNSVGDAWSASVTYAVGKYCIRNNILYRCIVQNTNQAPPNTTYWTQTSVGAELQALHTLISNL